MPQPVAPESQARPVKAEKLTNGVYHHGSGRAEARFRNITYWRQ